MGLHTIKFNKIENGSIFTSDFAEFNENNEIKFSNAGFAVIYGPNGIGKTSLAKVFSGEDGTALSFEYDSVKYNNGSEIFHVINDQNHRNIINGNAKDFLLGDNIQKEFELQQYISEKFKEIFSKAAFQLKDAFGISTVSNPLISLIHNTELQKITQNLANRRYKVSNKDIDDFLDTMSSLQDEKLPAKFSEDKYRFFINGYSDKKSILCKVLEIKEPDIEQVNNAHEIEEDSVAIDVLTQFSHKTKCIVCDTDGIDSEKLKEEKTRHRQIVVDSLTKQMRSFMEDIVSLQPPNDPYLIKKNVVKSLEEGDFVYIKKLQEEINCYKVFFNIKLNLMFKEMSEITQLKEKYTEYKKLLSEKIDIQEEDFLYIRDILSNSMDKKIDVQRDKNKNIKIFLGGMEFLEQDRNGLPLSTGEQNFISLCFEFLKAKNSKKQIIVLDDPISSFDSIYKNKVVFALMKILEEKACIVLTHNLDLLRLLESQYNNSFNLYLLNNTEGENNGFIVLCKKEKNMLINLQELLNTFRSGIFDSIKDNKMYLVAMIPFMRGYANIINDKASSGKLTELMHGYKKSTVDIAKIYFELFGNGGKDVLQESLEINVEQLLQIDVDNIQIVDADKYPLLEKTLHHSFTYLFLRLLVEKTLVEKYNIDTENYKQLGEIIYQAFKDNDIDTVRNRVSLTSKKTLINEFNHFEGNLSIFQPAIDITNSALEAERKDIVSFIKRIKQT